MRGALTRGGRLSAILPLHPTPHAGGALAVLSPVFRASSQGASRRESRRVTRTRSQLGLTLAALASRPTHNIDSFNGHHCGNREARTGSTGEPKSYPCGTPARLASISSLHDDDDGIAEALNRDAEFDANPSLGMSLEELDQLIQRRRR
jgi:hypothetical protein